MNDVERFYKVTYTDTWGIARSREVMAENSIMAQLEVLANNPHGRIRSVAKV